MEFPRKDGGRILCVGLVCLDLLIVTKDYPIEDTDSRSLSQHWQRGGNASNNCTILSHLGAPCELLATLSNSQDLGQAVHDKFVINDIKMHDILIDNCVYYSNYGCPSSIVIINVKNGSRTILHQKTGLPELTFQDFKKLDLINYRWIHFEGRCPDEYLKMLEYIYDWNQRQPEAQRIGVSIEFEKPSLDFKLPSGYVDILFVSKDFALFNGFESKEEAVNGFRKKLNQCCVVCPWGEDGVAASTPSGDTISVKAFSPSKIVDTLGAGDTFIASSIYGLTKSLDLPSALTFGCRIAGEKCGMLGYTGLKDIVLNLKDYFMLNDV